MPVVSMSTAIVPGIQMFLTRLYQSVQKIRNLNPSLMLCLIEYAQNMIDTVIHCKEISSSPSEGMHRLCRVSEYTGNGFFKLPIQIIRHVIIKYPMDKAMCTCPVRSCIISNTKNYGSSSSN